MTEYVEESEEGQVPVSLEGGIPTLFDGIITDVSVVGLYSVRWDRRNHRILPSTALDNDAAEIEVDDM